MGRQAPQTDSRRLASFHLDRDAIVTLGWSEWLLSAAWVGLGGYLTRSIFENSDFVFFA